MKPKTIETIIKGIIAGNMGYCNGSNVCRAGEEVFAFISRMTHKDFAAIKKHAKDETRNSNLHRPANKQQPNEIPSLAQPQKTD